MDAQELNKSLKKQVKGNLSTKDFSGSPFSFIGHKTRLLTEIILSSRLIIILGF